MIATLIPSRQKGRRTDEDQILDTDHRSTMHFLNRSMTRALWHQRCLPPIHFALCESAASSAATSSLSNCPRYAMAEPRNYEERERTLGKQASTINEALPFPVPANVPGIASQGIIFHSIPASLSHKVCATSIQVYYTMLQCTPTNRSLASPYFLFLPTSCSKSSLTTHSHPCRDRSCPQQQAYPALDVFS